MNCPYCSEDIDERAPSCRLCGADLTLILPLVATVQRLIKRVELLEGQVEGGAGTALDAPSAEATKPTPALLPIPSISDELAVMLGLFGIALAHFAVVVVFDASLTILLSASIIVPFCVGFLRSDGRDHPVLRVMCAALALAIAALAEMSLITWSLWRVPIAPQDTHDWRELLYYGGSIAAGFIIGALARGLVRFWYVGRGRIWPRRKSGIVYRALRSIGNFDAEMLEKSEKVIRQLEYTVMNVTALIVSVFFLFDHLQPALSWLKTVKAP